MNKDDIQIEVVPNESCITLRVGQPIRYDYGCKKNNYFYKAWRVTVTLSFKSPFNTIKPDLKLILIPKLYQVQLKKYGKISFKDHSSVFDSFHLKGYVPVKSKLQHPPPPPPGI